MKRFCAVFIIAVMGLAATACGSRNNNTVVLQNPSSASGSDVTSLSGENEDSQDEEDTANLSEISDSQNEGSNLENSVDGDSSGKNSNILVAYFSRVGNTEWEDGVDAVTSASLNVENGEYVGNAEYLAHMAAEVTGGDLFLIQTEDTYPSDYRETTDVASTEQADHVRPALASHVDDMDRYETVVLIYPNWW